MRHYRAKHKQANTKEKKGTNSSDNSGKNKKQPNNDYFREYMKRRRFQVDKQKKQIQAENVDSTTIFHNVVSRQNCDVAMKHTCNKENKCLKL